MNEAEIAARLYELQRKRAQASNDRDKEEVAIDATYRKIIADVDYEATGVYREIHAAYPALHGFAFGAHKTAKGHSLSYNDWRGYGAKPFTTFDKLAQSVKQLRIDDLQTQLQNHRLNAENLEKQIAQLEGEVIP